MEMRPKGGGGSKKKRRTKTAEKTLEQREDALPWDLPIAFDPTFLPTSLYKNSVVTPLLFTSANVPAAMDSFYSFSNSPSVLHPRIKNARMEPRGSLPGGVSTSANSQCPVPPRESSNSCPTIVGQGRHMENDMSSSKTLPPIGVFWDIENCSVPKGRSALVAVQRLRQKFFVGHLEAEFVCVCDIRKEAPSVIQELNDAQVSVVHVSGNSKNAADDKLRQAMRRYADISCSNPLNSSWTYPATIVLISGDINFATDLSDLRYRKRLYVILLHNKHAPEALLLCAHEHYEFHDVLTDLPFRYGYKDHAENSSLSIPLKGGLSRVDALVTELPASTNPKTQNFIRNRLRKLSENCGGKVLSVRGQWALIRFPNYDSALRASKRMNGEDVLGNKIRVVCCPQMEFTSAANYQTANVHEEFIDQNQKFKMHTSKNQGIFSAPSWKPTWNRHTSRHAAEVSKSYVASTTAQSNSSSPNETSRDGSPSVLKSHNVPSVSVQAQLNNSAQYQPMVPITAANVNVASPSFAFHQNLYPMDGEMNIRQECQTPPQVNPEVVGTPRLYSTAGIRDSFGHAIASQQHIHMQLDALNKSPPVANGILIPHAALTPLPSTAVDSQSGQHSAMTGNIGNYSKYRNHDGGGDSFDLNVTNIDPSLGDWKAIRSALMTAFAEHVSVRGIWVYGSNDGSTSAIVRLCNKDDAHYAVAQLHRRKIGSKRIFISFEQGHTVDHETLKKEVASLLQDVPNHTLPLFKFREMFEKRYKRSVSSSDLYRMKDVVLISESSSSGNGTSTPSSGRNISLTNDWHSKDGKGLDLYCKVHPPRGKSQKMRMGWAEKEAEVMLPNVMIEIKVLAARIHSLLQSHDGGFPMISFLDCYESEFGVLERASEGRGVPLEHLISCIQGVEIVFAENGMKRVQWHEKKEHDQAVVNQPLATQLAQFGRELIDLLKTFPKCTLPFARLIPSYHAHFGRQCRVADYGHFSLSALLQTLPHVVQIMGAAQNRVLTLSHRAQMKRFATDMLRVLKSQGGPKKQIRMDDYPSTFATVFPQRQFQPEDYGLCQFSDLVTELVENSTLVALVKDEDGNNMLAVPKREQTPQEIHRTRIFATEVVELLRHSTRCELEFSKFVPYYHHHFQKQCRVSDYGFGKLAELFDAICDTVLILSPNSNDCGSEDKIIRLTPKEQIKVIGEQVCKILESRRLAGEQTCVQELVDCFLEEHGFLLRPELCDAESLEDLIYHKLDNFIKVEDGEIIPVDRVQIEDLSQKAEMILQESPEFTMDIDELISALNEKCEIAVDDATIEKDLNHVVVISSSSEQEKRTVSLSPLRIFAYEMTKLLEAHGGYLPLSNLENSYLQKFGVPIRPANLGYPSVLPMLQAIPDTVSLRGKQRTRRIVVLNSAKAALEIVSDESSGSYGKQTPRNNGDHWKNREARPHSAGGSSKYGKYTEWAITPKRRSAPPPPLFSPLGSPAFSTRPNDGNVFTFDRPTPLSPPVYDVWMQDSVAPGSPPMSPPVVWTCHPIFYPSSPPPGGPGNILVPSTYVTPAPWSPTPVTSNCYERMAPPQPPTMLGNEFLFGQNRLAASFERLTVDTGNDA